MTVNYVFNFEESMMRLDSYVKTIGAIIPSSSKWHFMAEFSTAFQEELSKVKNNIHLLDSQNQLDVIRTSEIFTRLMTHWKKDSSIIEQVNILSSHIEKFAATDGLYRINGEAKKIQALQNTLKQNTQAPIEEGIHVVTGTMKAVFRDMKTPLLAPQQEALMLAAKELDLPTKKAALHAAISKLPAYHQTLLHNLLGHLRVVAAQSGANQMNASNLATCFAPNLFAIDSSGDNPTALFKRVVERNNLIAFLIEHPEF